MGEPVQTWKILFYGQILPGFDPKQVKTECIQMFKLTEEKYTKMFSGSEITLKKGLDMKSLAAYLAHFEKCGLKIKVEEEPIISEGLQMMAMDERPEAEQE